MEKMLLHFRRVKLLGRTQETKQYQIAVANKLD